MLSERLEIGEEEEDDWYETALSQAHLVFVSSDQDFVVPLRNVNGVRANSKLVPIPDVPAWICGALSHRGDILPVVDLRRRMGSPPLEKCNRQVLVLVQCDDEKGALLVDAVDGTVDILPEQIKTSGAGPNSCVLGLAEPEEGGVKLVINLSELLNPGATRLKSNGSV